jgi:hypothetical protein
MPARLVIALLLLGAETAAAQPMQPGEWEFTSTTTSPAMPSPHTMTFRNCVKKEDADDPTRWMGKQNQKSECKVTPGRKTKDSYTWEMTCPDSKLSGTVRFRGGTALESDMHMTGEQRGRKFEVRTKMTGKRLGPCK